MMKKTILADAREWFRSSQCSTFVMAREDLSLYKRYKELNIPVEIENSWRSERFAEYSECIKEATTCEPIWLLISRMSDLVSSTKSVQDINTLYEIIGMVKEALTNKERIITSETINGRRHKIQRSGLIYLAYDLGEINLSRQFSSLSLELSNITTDDIELMKRTKRSIQLCNEIIEELFI